MAVPTKAEERPIVTRRAAKRAGLKRYFTGKPCPQGHIAERIASAGVCIVCLRARRDAWKAANPEKVREARGAYYKAHKSAELAAAVAYQQANRAKVTAKNMEYRRAHMEEYRAWTAAWWAANPGKARVYIAKRRAMKLTAGGTYTPQDVQALFKLQRGRCAHTWCRASLRSRYHVDHIMPLARGGSNDRKNLQLLCQPCNNQKHAKHPIDFARAHGLLL